MTTVFPADCPPTSTTAMKAHQKAFTLMELAIVVLVFSLLAAAAFRYAANASNTANYASLNATLDVIEAALQNYRNSQTRIPCPSDITLAENSSSFGVEVGTSGDGNCTGYNFINAVEADAPSTANEVVAGGVPTKTLRLEDKYAYDPWGRKLLFVVDKRMTGSNSFTTYAVGNSTIGTIVIKSTTTDALSDAVASNGIYALVSYGPNGHGGYVRNPSSTSTRFNAGSTNSDEQQNCHCDSTATATAFDRIFIQKPKTPSTTLTNMFDDVVRVKTRPQMANYNELQ